MSEKNVADQLLKYLQAHPQAGDTLEGIVKWWLLRQQLNESVAAVQQALEQLTHNGFVYERRTRDGKTLYFAADTTEDI